MMRHASIRLRLTFWYGAVLSAILIAFSASVYLLMRHHLLALTDAGLAEELTELADEVAHSPSPTTIGPRYAQHEGYELQISTPDGRVLFRSDRIVPTGLPLAGKPDVPGGAVGETVVLARLGRMRLASRPIASPFGRLVIQAATSLGPFDAASRELLTVLLITGTTAVSVSIGVGYLLARKALAPVDRMVAEAAEITATRLDRRLEVPQAKDELARLARTLNDMIERLERSFARVRQFTADAAHELRTPLAVIRTSVEVALREARDPGSDRRVFEDLLDEADRLGRIVSQLLDLCREDHGITTSSRRLIRLNELAYEMTDLMQVAAGEKGLHLEVKGFPPCRVRGDEDRLRQLLINLLDNAIKYTPPEGSVTVHGTIFDCSARIEVIDTGCGISPEHLPHVFERFYRADGSRGRIIDGTGLGLAICRSIAEGHRGQLWVESEPGCGTKVVIVLPREG